MLEKYVTEFIALIKYLLSQPHHKTVDNYLIVDKQILLSMMNRNRFVEGEAKLKVWKALNWIKTDNNRLTVRVIDPATGRQRPMIKISLTVYETIRDLTQNS